jgi:hypothetical protein
MKNGDISNEVPPRLFVVLDVVTIPEEETTKILGLIPRTKQTFSWNLQKLQQVWNISNKYSTMVELLAYGVDQDTVDGYMEELDEQGINPFNFGIAVDDIEVMIDELPYRFNVKGIIDIPQRVAQYGSWGLELDNL